MNERLSGILTFVQAAEAGSFALAAARLRVTRSAVGKTIARMEERLGVRLFHRTTRRQSLTDEGQAYYERCVRALAELDAAEADLESKRRELTGRLRLSAPVGFGRHCVAPVLLNLMRAHPRLEIELSLDDRFVDLADEGFDLGIRVGPMPDSAHLTSRRLGTQRMGIGASPAYLARHGHPGDLGDLSGHRAILYSRGGNDRTWPLRQPDGTVRTARIDTALRLDDLHAMVDAAVAGAGLVWLPLWLLAPHVRAGQLVLVMDSERVQAKDIHAVWPSTRHLPSRVRAAIDALVAEIPGRMGLGGGLTPDPSPRSWRGERDDGLQAECPLRFPPLLPLGHDRGEGAGG